MAIVKMKRLRLLAMAECREELLRLLQHMGCVEVDEPELPDGDPLWAGLSRVEDDRSAQAREVQAGAERALEVLRRHAPARGRPLDPKPEVAEGSLFDPGQAGQASQEAQHINHLDARMGAIRAEQAKLKAQKAQLAPWLGLDVPLETCSSAQVEVQFGTLPAGVTREQAQQALGELAQLTQAGGDSETRACLLLCHRAQAEGTLEALKALGWSQVHFRGWSGTAAENDRRIDGQLAQLEEELAGIEARLAGMGELRDPIQRLADRAGLDARREQSKQRLRSTGKTFYLEGWAPEERWPELKRALEPYPCAWEISDPAPEEYPKVPVELKNNWFTRPLNMVTEMYSLPAYGTLDPNPLMAPFFILFYGVMMADMGYGLIMILAGSLVLRKKKPGGTMGHLCGLMVLCGISTFIMGAVTGGFFGDFPTQLAKLINPESTFALPALFTPLEDTMMILVGAMGLGFVQIITGMAISFARKVKSGQVMDAVWEEVTWWIVFAGLALAVLGVTNLVILLGGAMVVAGPLLTGKGLGKVTGIFGSLYNHVTGYFGDVLSYSRLMALMLAGSVIAQVFNTLGAIPGNIVIFLVVSLVGNALNFALNLLGCYVHDLRLQCLEYFGKFYEDGGRPFRPLDMQTKYYRVVKQ